MTRTADSLQGMATPLRGLAAETGTQRVPDHAGYQNIVQNIIKRDTISMERADGHLQRICTRNAETENEQDFIQHKHFLSRYSHHHTTDFNDFKTFDTSLPTW